MEDLDTKLDTFGITKHKHNRNVLYSIDSNIIMEHVNIDNYCRSVLRMIEKDYRTETKLNPERGLQVHILQRGQFGLDNFYNSVEKVAINLNSSKLPRLENSNDGTFTQFAKWIGTTMMFFAMYKTAAHYAEIPTTNLADMAAVVSGMLIGLRSDSLRNSPHYAPRDYFRIADLIVGNKNYYDEYCKN